MNAKTGHYASKIINVYPKENTTLPPLSHFQGFFSQFGPIFTVYRHRNPRRSIRPPHIFVIFKDKDSVANVKKHWAQQDTFDLWKKSCDIRFGITSCPAAMMGHIRSITGGEKSGRVAKTAHIDQNTSGSKSQLVPSKEETARAPQLRSLKRNRGDQSGADGPHKRTKIAPDDTSSSVNQNTVPPHGRPPQLTTNPNAHRETPPHIPSIRRGMFGFNQLPTHHGHGSSSHVPKPAGAAKLKLPSGNTRASAPEMEAEKQHSELEKMRAKCDKIKSERDQLQVERDEARDEGQKYRVERDKARVEIERYRMERDEAVEQCELGPETYRELREQIERLEKTLAKGCRELSERIEGLGKTLKGKDKRSRLQQTRQPRVRKNRARC